MYAQLSSLSLVQRDGLFSIVQNTYFVVHNYPMIIHVQLSSVKFSTGGN